MIFVECLIGHDHDVMYGMGKLLAVRGRDVRRAGDNLGRIEGVETGFTVVIYCAPIYFLICVSATYLCATVLVDSWVEQCNMCGRSLIEMCNRNRN